MKRFINIVTIKNALVNIGKKEKHTPLECDVKKIE